VRNSSLWGQLWRYDTYIGTGVQHCPEAKNGDGDFLLPERPVQRVIGVLTGLRRQDDMRITSFTVLKSLRDCFRVCSFVIEQDRSRDMVELGIYAGMSILRARVRCE